MVSGPGEEGDGVPIPNSIPGHVDLVVALLCPYAQVHVTPSLILAWLMGGDGKLVLLQTLNSMLVGIILLLVTGGLEPLEDWLVG